MVDGDTDRHGHPRVAGASTGSAAAAQDLTVIEPGRGWALRAGELWRARELLYFFVWRDLKVRYKQTAIGASWAILQPIALTAVFTLFLGGLLGISPEGLPYALFALSGLVPWTLFSQTLGRASESLVLSANLLQKVYFPRLLLPISSVGTPLIDYGIGLIVLLVAMPMLSVSPTLSVLWLVPLTLLATGAALAVGIWFAAINVRYRDVRQILPSVIQVWFFATPIIYAVELVPEEVRWLYFMNPMAGVIGGFRWALFAQGAPPVVPIIVSGMVTAVVFATGVAYFRRVERSMADII